MVGIAVQKRKCLRFASVKSICCRFVESATNDHLSNKMWNECMSRFSIARKNDGGPPPLRDRHHLWGLPGLRPQDQKKVTMGTDFMFFTQRMATLCHKFGVLWSVENPASSFIWVMPPILDLAQLPNVQTITLDMCRFASVHKKPTSIMAALDLHALARSCDMVARPHEHEPLVGIWSPSTTRRSSAQSWHRSTQQSSVMPGPLWSHHCDPKIL